MINQTEDNTNQKTSSYLSFKLSDEYFAIEVMRIIEILEVPKITKVPQSPDFLVGVINLRGAVLPVIDSRLKFGLSKIDYTINTCILVLKIEVEEEDVFVGALVDSVSEVFDIDLNKIKASPTLATKYRADYIEGMIQIEDGFMMVLNIDKVFSSNELDSIATVKEVSPIKE